MLVGECRAQFVPQMVSSLMKLGLPQNAALENRRLAIDLAALLVRWEQQRLTSPPPAPAADQQVSGDHHRILPLLVCSPLQGCLGM